MQVASTSQPTTPNQFLCKKGMKCGGRKATRLDKDQPGLDGNTPGQLYGSRKVMNLIVGM